MPEAIFLGRGFDPVHQKVALYVDFKAQCLRARTEIIIAPSDAHLKFVRLQCSQCEISSVSINDKEASWSYNDMSTALQLNEHSTVHQHHQLEEKLYNNAPGIREQGDLIIAVPRGIVIKPNQSFYVAASMKPGDDTDAQEDGVNMSNSAYRTMTVVIEYRVSEPTSGITFEGVAPSDHRFPQLFTRNYPIVGSTCAWMPCIDGIWTRCTWEFEFNTPRTIGEIAKAKTRSGSSQLRPEKGVAADDPDFDESMDYRFVTVCSGDIVEEVSDPADHSRKISRFLMSTPVAAQFISFAIAPFQEVNLTDFRELEEDDVMGSSAVEMIGYCLPTFTDDLKNTCAIMYKAMDFFIREYGSYPYTTFKLCFVDDLVQDSVSSASLGLVSNRLLYPKDVIDTYFDVTKALTFTLAQQWIGVNIVPKRWSDLWVTIGIAHYISDLFMKFLVGHNDYRFRMKMAASRVCDMDIGQAPLCSKMIPPIDVKKLDFIALKAPVVLFILDRRMSKSGGSLGLSRTLPKIFLQEVRGELPDSALSTEFFLRSCEKVSHMRLENFADEWIYGQGYPIFRVVQRFNRKRMMVEMGINQVQANEIPAKPLREDTFVEEANLFLDDVEDHPVRPVFSGPMTIRIHEADGTPYEHIVELRETFTKLDIQYNTKYKRIKRSRERASKVNGVTDHYEGYELKSLGNVLQSDTDVAEWKLEDWSPEQEEQMAAEAFEWIRVDADFEWICRMHLAQPEHMYISQLQQDRDVVAQVEAVNHLGRDNSRPSAVTSSFLTRTLYDRHYYYGIRQLACEGLAHCARENLEFIGLFHLLKFLEHRYCHPGTLVPTSNDFCDLQEYFVKNAVIRSLAKIRTMDGSTHPQAKTVLLDLLRFKDNSGNEFSDCYYSANLMNCLAGALSPSDAGVSSFELDAYKSDPLLKEALSEFDRMQRMDCWMPSYRNVITVAALQAKQHLSRHRVILPPLREALEHCHPGHYLEVRIVGYDTILRCGGVNQYALVRFVFETIQDDASFMLRRSICDSFIRGISAHAIRGGQMQNGVQVENIGLEEDNLTRIQERRDARAKKNLAGAIYALRDEYLYHEYFKSELWSLINSEQTDFLTKRDLIKLCNVMFEATDSLRVKLDFPSFKLAWRAKHLGEGVMEFKKSRLRQPKQKSTNGPKVKLKIGLKAK